MCGNDTKQHCFCCNEIRRPLRQIWLLVFSRLRNGYPLHQKWLLVFLLLCVYEERAWEALTTSTHMNYKAKLCRPQLATPHACLTHDSWSPLYSCYGKWSWPRGQCSTIASAISPTTTSCFLSSSASNPLTPLCIPACSPAARPRFAPAGLSSALAHETSSRGRRLERSGSTRKRHMRRTSVRRPEGCE